MSGQNGAVIAGSDTVGSVGVLDLLRCPACGAFPLAAQEGSISCNQCRAKYPMLAGVPVLRHRSSADLVYSSAEHGVTSRRSRTRRLLRRLGIEETARQLWHAYLTLDSWIAPNGPTDPTFWIQRMRSAVPPSPNNVLDFGGGNGAFRSYLTSEEDLYVVLEVDEHSRAVTENQHLHQYVIGDGHTTLFVDNCFDVIAMFEVLEHVRNPFQVFTNCARWLRPGGVLLLSTPQYWHVHGWPCDYFRYTIFGLQELARHAGLQIIDYWDMGGPCQMIWSAIRLNFGFFLNLPVLRQTVTHPMCLLARLGDAVFFRNNLGRRNPDTRGWMIIAKKPS